MTRAARLGLNALFALAFLGGLALVWTGLEALVLGGEGGPRALATLGAGFLVWLVLAIASEVPARAAGSRS